MASRWAVGGGLSAVGVAGIALAAWLMVPIRPGPAPSVAAPVASAPGGSAMAPPSAPSAAEPSQSPASPTVSPVKPGESPAAQPPEALFARCAPAVVRVVIEDKRKRPAGQGSGFFVSADGLLVTNHHVVADAATIRVITHADVELKVTQVVAVDPASDLALLRVAGQSFPHLELADGLPAIGTRAYAIGSPQGLANTLSEGLVSGVRGRAGEVKLIQTTAAISPGSSGGPLLNPDGRVVGVTTLYLQRGQNLNFAVDAQRVREFIQTRKPLAAATRPSISAGSGDDVRRAAALAWLDRAMLEAAGVRTKQSRAYYQVAVHYAALGDVARCEAAVQRARLVMDEHDLVTGEFECQLVAVLVRCGSVPSARELADSFRKPQTRTRAVEQIAKTAAAMGDRKTAEEYFAQHRKLQAPLWDAQPEARRGVLQREYDLAVALELGGVDAAMKVVERMADTNDPKAAQRRPGPPQNPPQFPNAKSHGLAEVVHYLLRSGDRRRAAALLPRIFDDAEREFATLRVARDHLDRGEFPEAQALGNTLQAPRSAAEFQTALARALFKKGDVEGFKAAVREATRLAGLVDGQVWQDLATTRVVEALAEAGEFAPALRMAGEVKDPSLSPSAIAHVALAQARAGHGDAAVQTARQIKDKRLADHTMTAILEARASIPGQGNGAFAMAQRMGSKDLVARCAVLVALADVKRGWYSGVPQLLRRHQVDAGRRDAVFAAMAVAQAEAGLAKNAYESADAIRLPPLRGATFRIVVRSTYALMQGANWDAMFSALPTPEDRVGAFLGLAEGELGPPPAWATASAQ